MAGRGVEMRRIKRITLFLVAAIFLNLAGCLPMNEEQIAKQAQKHTPSDPTDQGAQGRNLKR
jgi:hypothetical protein